ncbi:MAG: hypothetical protein KTR30_00490 [Saprospiraceae bacterium]|nr:hypothetical protein [Saprospiraceae bacterium]
MKSYDWKLILPTSCRAGLLGLLAILCFACGDQDGKKDIRDYYYPIRQLEDGLVYEYRSIGNDSLPPVYWYYRSFIEEDGVFLTATYYEHDLIPRQLAKEEMVSNGMIQNDLALFVTDSVGKQQPLNTEVLAGNIFPFEVSEGGGVFLYKIQISSPDEPHLVTTLIKNRRYVGDTTFVFKKKKLPSVAFEVKELVELDDKEQGGMEPQWDGREIYAKNIGLVFYEKQLGETPLTYALFDRYPMTVLEDKFKQMMSSDNTYEQN